MSTVPANHTPPTPEFVIKRLPNRRSSQKYLVSNRGESQWVKNVRSDPNVTLKTRFGTTIYVATETPVENRQPILDAYKVKTGKIVVGYFGELPDPADHPVFTLTPAT